MSKITKLPATTTFTVDQAIRSALNESASLDEILIVGYDLDGDFFIRSSRMLNRDALWLLEQAKIQIIGGVL